MANNIQKQKELELAREKRRVDMEKKWNTVIQKSNWYIKKQMISKRREEHCQVKCCRRLLNLKKIGTKKNIY